MKVIALTSFVARIDGVKYRPDKGEELEMPKGADWIKAGLAEKKAVKRSDKAKAPESAALEAPEKAVKPAAKKKEPAKKKG